MNASPVGFFDSGVGGLCIRDAFIRLCPAEPTVYIADSANCPYGNRPAEEIRRLAFVHTRTLLEKYGCKMVVVACNTATAAAIDALRAAYPKVPFVGLEPAVKPAALRSKTGVVGVLATAGTFNGRLYNETKAKFAKDVTVLATVADEFVTLVEKGETAGAEAERIVRARIEPLLRAGADRIVLGCTHFPHLRPLIEAVAAGRAEVLDPSEAVARQAKRLLAKHGLAAAPYPPTTAPRPPTTAPRPPTTAPRPPTTAPRPPTTAPRPPTTAPRPPTTAPRPPTTAPRPPTTAPRPPTTAPRPPTTAPRSARDLTSTPPQHIFIRT